MISGILASPGVAFAKALVLKARAHLDETEGRA